jgi:hypothetical protein
MGGTGNIRTLRSQSGSNGSRTLGSILASDAAAGAGSARRIYAWYVVNRTPEQFYQQVYGFKMAK